ncbi:MAG: RNA chaperone Hfq [Acidobacteria bacterium]|nr:RNA chaperone Hfq [Acidobacteriota bacterium]
METGNRRLIRPPIKDLKDNADKGRGAPPLKKQVPPEQTNAENFYYVKQMQAKTPMVFVLKGGETLNGVIEWYDKTCLKVNRDNGPNILLYKANIAYMYKDESVAD